MLRLVIPAQKVFNNETQEFGFSKEVSLQLEHSLVSISKWESKWHIPFLNNQSLTSEQLVDYVRCMTITQNVPKDIYYLLTKENYNQIEEYIHNPMTATTVKHDKRGPSREIITSELIYYWMIALNIPPHYDKWHLNRLLTLIDICNAKNQKPKKMSNAERIAEQRQLNEARKAKWKTRG